MKEAGLCYKEGWGGRVKEDLGRKRGEGGLKRNVG